ncbi:unnamed protein product [Leptosia nina]|uniref:Uncharacterized protein n=1 Tax=Leptosia nina TaxID=320188 RepID=A0AAV1JVL7_9NEOP
MLSQRSLDLPKFQETGYTLEIRSLWDSFAHPSIHTSDLRTNVLLFSSRGHGGLCIYSNPVMIVARLSGLCWPAAAWATGVVSSRRHLSRPRGQQFCIHTHSLPCGHDLAVHYIILPLANP